MNTVWLAIGEVAYETRQVIGVAHNRANAVKMCTDNPKYRLYDETDGPDYDHQWVQRWVLGSTTRHGELETVK